MSDAAQRRAIADKIAADVARLRKEIADRRAHLVQAKARTLSKLCRRDIVAGERIRIVEEASWFTAWSRYAPAVAKAEGALSRALKRRPAAILKAEFAEGQERKAAAIRATIRARNVALMRTLDALKEAAPAIDQRWKVERKDEEKRLKKLKKQLEKRTRRDITARPDWMKKPLALPPPIEQPNFSEVEAEIPPPREGLIPGTYRVIDPARFSLGLLNPDPLPTRWNARHVGVRLIEAHDVLRRMPASIWPKGYGAMWPAYSHSAGELAIQAGAGTLQMGRNLIVRTASADEVARMNEALDWIMQFLSGCNYWSLAALNGWASSSEATPDDKDAPTDLLEFIAAALNAAKEVVR
jgi:hypothetical protein